MSSIVDVNGLQIHENGFNYKGKSFSYDQVNGLYFFYENFTYCSVPTSKRIKLKVRVSDGNQIAISNHGLYIRDPREKIHQAYQIL